MTTCVGTGARVVFGCGVVARGVAGTGVGEVADDAVAAEERSLVVALPELVPHAAALSVSSATPASLSPSGASTGSLRCVACGSASGVVRTVSLSSGHLGDAPERFGLVVHGRPPIEGSRCLSTLRRGIGRGVAASLLGVVGGVAGRGQLVVGPCRLWRIDKPVAHAPDGRLGPQSDDSFVEPDKYKIIETFRAHEHENGG